MYAITITQPDDWHLHCRDGDNLKRTVPDAAVRFARAIVMPNILPPVTTVDAASAYRERILSALPQNQSFEPLMTLYLTDNTTSDTIINAKNTDFMYAAKLYPAGATTHSDAGITKFENLFPILAAMEKHDFPLLIHGEVNQSDVDIFDREKYFIENHLKTFIKQFPNLRIVLEHITTKEAVDFILSTPKNVAATITAHHLLLNRNAIFAGGICPHHYCLPVLKREHDRQALLHAATSGNPKFFLGSDSAPHSIGNKETCCGRAGIYTGHAAIELYAEAFEQVNALDKLENFASHYGADFYGLARNKNKLTLIKNPWQVPSTLSFGETKLKPFRAGEIIQWSLRGVRSP